MTPINPKPGDKVTARFTITAADAQIESVYYTVYLDGDVIGGDIVFGLEKGGSKVITFSFIVTEGSHVFSVKLDEESELDETNMGNNIAQQEFVVESSNSSPAVTVLRATIDFRTIGIFSCSETVGSFTPLPNATSIFLICETINASSLGSRLAEWSGPE